MVKVTAATSFIGDEGMWRAGETREVSNHRAHYLIEEGLAIEAADQGNTDLKAEPSALHQAAEAIGATVAESTGSEGLAAAADALGATVAEGDELPAVTHESLKKEDKPKAKTKEEKATRETKQAK
jgi:hypothetical protein